MGVLSAITRWRRAPAEPKRPVARRLVLRAGFDAAKTTDDNRRHWAEADCLSADAAATPDVRRILRTRARYESANNSYAKCLVAGTAQRDLLPNEKERAVRGMVTEDVARMEREMSSLSREFRDVEETHGRNTLTLVLAVAYIRKVLEHPPAASYLVQRHADTLAEFQKLAESPELNG